MLLSGWLRFSCWTPSRSLEDDRAWVARRFPWWDELEAATLLHEELDEKRRCELGKPGWTACCDAGERLRSPWHSEGFRKSLCGKEEEEGENRPYIGPVTSQVMGPRVTNSSWNLCLLSVFTPLCDVEAPWETEFLYSGTTPHWTCGFQALVYSCRLELLVHQKPCPNTLVRQFHHVTLVNTYLQRFWLLKLIHHLILV